MADKVVQLKNKDGDNLYPVSVLPGERILWEDTLEVAPDHSEGVNDMIGATASSAGVHGLVPAPAAGDQDKVLKGDGTWASATFDDMTGATASAAGVHGLAPQPAAGDQNKFLKGDGTWGAAVSYETTTGSNIDIGDLYADIGANYNKILGATAVDADDCIWTPRHLDETISAGRLTETRVFAFASMTDPIANTTVYGECKTTIYYNFSKYHVIQEFTVFQDATQANIVKFRRKWYTTANASTPSAASWTKLPWYALEYPLTNIKSYLTNNFSGTYLNFMVTGGIAHIRGQGLSSSNPGSAQPNLTTAIPGILAKDDANGICVKAVANDTPTLVKFGKTTNVMQLFGYATNAVLYFSILIPLGY